MYRVDGEELQILTQSITRMMAVEAKVVYDYLLVVGTAEHLLEVGQFRDQFLEQRDREALGRAEFTDSALSQLQLREPPQRVGGPPAQQSPPEWSLGVVEDPEQSVVLPLVLL